MRKTVKIQVHEFLQLIGKLHDEFKIAIQSGNIVAAMEILVNCQDQAIQIGTLIESS
ncbi:hypothetical protein lbkm_3997 [Lachnospiraceae bacterium KM106-2]|nr:hypothetical protein lbkm_3997 [Lachnospiraceae bacterium KM106-2]